MLKEKEDFYVEEEWEGNRKQHKKKGLLGRYWYILSAACKFVYLQFLYYFAAI